MRNNGKLNCSEFLCSTTWDSARPVLLQHRDIRVCIAASLGLAGLPASRSSQHGRLCFASKGLHEFRSGEIKITMDFNPLKLQNKLRIIISIKYGISYFLRIDTLPSFSPRFYWKNLLLRHIKMSLQSRLAEEYF